MLVLLDFVFIQQFNRQQTSLMIYFLDSNAIAGFMSAHNDTSQHFNLVMIMKWSHQLHLLTLAIEMACLCDTHCA